VTPFDAPIRRSFEIVNEDELRVNRSYLAGLLNQMLVGPLV
jgi:hypothetical protein